MGANGTWTGVELFFNGRQKCNIVCGMIVQFPRLSSHIHLTHHEISYNRQARGSFGHTESVSYASNAVRALKCNARKTKRRKW